MKRVCGQLLLAIGFGVALTSIARAQTVWTLTGDFSATSNPAGAWSYGSATTAGGAFTVYPNFTSSNGISTWTTPSSYPSINFNPASSSVQVGTVLWPANSIIQHPGPNGELAVARWTAPASGNFSLSATFTSGDVFGATTNVFVMRNGVALGSGNVDASNSYTFSVGSVALGSGDFVDFLVGFGTNGSYGFDSTVTSATISALAVPEPSTWVLIGCGAFAVALSRSRLRCERLWCRPSDHAGTAGRRGR